MSTLSRPAAAFRSQLVRKKPIGDVNPGGAGELKRSLGTFHLAMIGVGCTIGTGIFFSLSTAVPKAGPAVIISFVVAGLAAGLAALCYAELAAVIPVSGSTYSYAYSALGELAAMVMAACLLLEYGVATATSAVGWSGYLNHLFIDLTGLHMPYWALNAPGSDGHGHHGIINLPAVVLVLMCAALLIRGAGESMLVNTIMVIIKLGVLAAFAAIAITGFRSGNFTDFAPKGVSGIGAGSATIFFTFIGIDAVSTAGEEVRDPRRTLPRAIVIAMIIVITCYLLVAVTAIGAQRWTRFEGQEAGLAVILQNLTGQRWPGTALAAGAVISIFSVCLVSLYGQTRILFSMGRDGMIPGRFARVHDRTRTPVFNTVVVSAAVALAAAFVPLNALADVTSIGTLAAFIVVAITVMILRRTTEGTPGGFRVPGYPITPVATVLVCLYVLNGLSWVTWAIFAAWIGTAVAFYLLWGRRHSALNSTAADEVLTVAD